MDPLIRMNTGNGTDYQTRFDDLMKEVFGFSFAPWFERGLWDERYESYSIEENGQLAANLCIFKMELTVSGKRMHAHQYGAVAVRPEHRGKGYSRLLFEKVQKKYPDTPAYLGANETVVDFYPRVGFRQVLVHRPVIKCGINNPALTAEKIDPDDPSLLQAVKDRNQYSLEMATLNTRPIEIFHLLLDYPECIYYIPQAGCYIVAEQRGNTLFVADVILNRPVEFETLRPLLPFTGSGEIEFGFNPDHLGVQPEWIPVDAKNPHFIRGEWDLPECFRFPEMAET